MKPEIKQQWLTALRSGEYTQVQSTLRKKDVGFCCLGVLCELVDPNGWHDGPTENPVAFKYGGSRDYSMPPLPLQDAIGFRASQRFPVEKLRPYVSMLPDGPCTFTLAELNDRGASFSEIADVIEFLLEDSE